MAILFESSTYIELLMKQALIDENLKFQEQFRVYEGGKFNQVKYVADFLIEYNNIRLIVECDGFHYHSGSSKKKNQAERDNWLLNKGFQILHFTSSDITHNMFGVIQTIKYHLKMPCKRSKVISTKKVRTTSKRVSKSRSNLNDDFEVVLYCFYLQCGPDICVVYKYRSIPHDKWSDIRVKFCTNVPKEMLETTAVYLALIDLKRSVSLKLHYGGSVYDNKFNFSKTFRKNLQRLITGEHIINTCKISKHYVSFDGNYRLNKKDPQGTMNELKSRCMQIAMSEERSSKELHIDYAQISLF